MITKEVFDFALNNGFLKLKDKFSNKMIEIPINIKEWEQDESEPKITKSLF